MNILIYKDGQPYTVLSGTEDTVRATLALDPVGMAAMPLDTVPVNWSDMPAYDPDKVWVVG